MKKTLKKIIEICLEENENCRNSDKDLLEQVYRKILTAEYGNDYLDYNRLSKLPPGASIKRIRAMIQNDEGKFIPTSEKTANFRRWDTEKWKDRAGVERLFPI